MRTFANLFLFFFVVDGGLSVVDDLLSFTLGIELLSPLRNINAFATLVLAVPMFFALGFDRRLPKRVFLPQLAFLLWASAGLWPLLGTMPLEVLGLVASSMQLLLGLLALAYLRWRSSSIQLTAADFEDEPFSLFNTLGYFASSLIVLPFIIGFLLLATASHQVGEQTAGFMRISTSGLHMKERIYQQGDKEVRLTGMIHIGAEDYYRELASSVDSERTIVLAEGVTDREGLLKNRFDYGDIGNALGLVSQEELDFDALEIDLAELEEMNWNEQDLQIPHIARADIDLSAFTPLTIEFLNVLGKLISGDGPLSQKLEGYTAWVEKNSGPEVYDILMGDILEKRNEVVIAHLGRALDHYDTVVVPWGAMHMPGIEEAVLQQGFLLAAEKERLSLAFRDLPYAELAGKLSSATRAPN